MMSSRTKNSDLVVLYYHKESFYSKKVLFALYEKDIKFKGVNVNVLKGQQFTEEFLALNPLAEVPVLVDNVKIIPDSAQIIDYLEDNFPGKKLVPSVNDQRSRVEYLNEEINKLDVRHLTYGSFFFDDLNLKPKAPYFAPHKREMFREIALNTAIYKEKAQNFPKHREILEAKFNQLSRDEIYLNQKKAYDNILFDVEKVLDECEAELASHDDPSWHLCSPNLSIVDISLSNLLYRLWQLGLEHRMWESYRPHLADYFEMMKKEPNFKKAVMSTSSSSRMMSTRWLSPDWIKDPLVLGMMTGAFAFLAIGFVVYRKSVMGPKLSKFRHQWQ